MRPLVRAAVAFFVLAGQGAAGQVVTRTQVPEVRLNVGPVAPTVNPAAGSGALGTMNSGMSFSGSVLSLRGGRIQEAPPDLPASVVPHLGGIQTPVSVPAALRSEGGAVFGAPGQPFPRQALDPEDPAMGQGSRGRLAGDVSEESSSAEFPEKAVAIGRHLKEAGKVSEQGSEFAEGFGRRLAELMAGSREHRSGGLEEDGLLGPGGAASLAGGAGLAAAGNPALSPARAAAVESGVEARIPSPGAAPAFVLDQGFPGVGRVLMEVSALTLDLTQVFPGGLNHLAAKAAAGAVRPLDGRRPWSSAERTAGAVRPLAVLRPWTPEDGAAGAPETVASREGRPSVYEAPDMDLAYPGGFGSFMASVGGAMASEGRGALESGIFIPLELKAAHAVREGASPETPASSSNRVPSAPLALLSYVLLPLFLAGLELRSRI